MKNRTFALLDNFDKGLICSEIVPPRVQKFLNLIETRSNYVFQMVAMDSQKNLKNTCSAFSKFVLTEIS